MQRSKIASPIVSAIDEFVKLESAGGVLLLAAAIIAMLIANSPLAGLHDALLETPVAVQVGELEIDKPLLLWINDGLMAVFFFLVGLEIKREVLEGELSSVSQVLLPGLGALGGMVVPAALFAALNWNDPVALDGWAIPVATDIAFALALLGLFGSRVPPALKIFLLTLAIFDDLAAIVIIALFYSSQLSLAALAFAAVALGVAIFMNRFGVTRISSYLFLAVVLWVAVLKSGVHATLSGVLIAFCIPMRDARGGSPLRELEHDLQGPVAYAILPLFAFANAGVALGGMSMADLVHPVTLGVAGGLLIGKPVGIVLFVGLMRLLRLADLPKGTNWFQLLGTASACGIGFTMSLFIAGLAFEQGSSYFPEDRLGVLIGSTLSALLAALLLHLGLPRRGLPRRGR
jgi:Na+:H+ antiporter, NhaA family